MELKDITEYREVLLRRPGKVDPKEAAAPSQTFEVVTAEMQVANLLFMYDMTGRGIGDRFDRPFCRTGRRRHDRMSHELAPDVKRSLR